MDVTLPEPGAAAMWTLGITTYKEVLRGAQHYYAKIEGPDAKVRVAYLIGPDDIHHLQDGGHVVGEPSERFLTVDAATEGGLTVFAHLAGPGDILVPDTEDEWPLAAPASVMNWAMALKAAGDLATWCRALRNWRQWAPGRNSGGFLNCDLVVVRATPHGYAICEDW